MSAPARFLLVVLLILAAAAIAMAPRQSEQVAMMRDREENARIVATLEPQLTNGPEDAEILPMLGQALTDLGMGQRAVDIMHRHIALRPDDGRAYAILADALKVTNDAPGRTAMLATSVRLAPTSPRVVELARLYQEQGRVSDEIELLGRFEADLSVSSGLRLRLAQGLDQIGRHEEAIAVLARADAREALTERATADERLLRADILLRTGRSAEAAALGRQWIVEWRQPYLALKLLEALAQGGPEADADSFADAAMAMNPEIRFYVAHQLAEDGAIPVAKHLLRSWVRATPDASMNDIAGFLTACRELGDPSIVWQAFGDTLRDDSPPQLGARFATAAIAEFGISALAPFWSSMPRAMLDANPLLEAQLAFYTGRNDLAGALIGKVQPAGLTESDQQIWLSLMTALEPPELTYARLQRLRIAGILPAGLLPNYVRLAASQGHSDEYRTALPEMTRSPK